MLTVFTNGVFDLLHVGHLRYLQSARGLGDRLIIGLNSDASVKLLNKGAARPYVHQEERRELLLGLSCVDNVIIFDEPTPLALLAFVDPDIYVKGGDYNLDQLPEATWMRERQRMVVLAPLTLGRSTTDLVRRIRQAP